MVVAEEERMKRRPRGKVAFDFKVSCEIELGRSTPVSSSADTITDRDPSYGSIDREHLFIIEDTQELDITVHVPVLDYMVVHPLEDAGYM